MALTTDGFMRHPTWQVRETVHRVFSAILTTAAWLEEEEGEEGEEEEEEEEEGEEEREAEAADEAAGATLGDGEEEEAMEEALCHLAEAAGAARELGEP